MKSLSQTIGQVFLIVAISTALALAVNSVRSRGLELSRNYFEKAKPVSQPAHPTTTNATDTVHTTAAEHDPKPQPSHADSQPAGNAPPQQAATQAAADPYPMGELGFREVTTSQVYGLLNDPRAESMDVLFVDARNDEYFQAGRIPRAVQLDHYYADQYMPNVLPLAEQAEWVVVYCGGGDCEDSMMVCNDLILEGVGQEKILLYKGGWKEWTEAGHPQETSSDE